MKLINISEDLKSNAYPGRGIVIGKSQDGQCAVTAYFIMGRSVNSRNRVFVAEGENLRTQAHDPALLTDPSLVIYFPVRMFPGGMIVTNGDQTDTIYNLLSTEAQSTPGCCFVRALRTRTFEPDPPLYTPRISGILEWKEGDFTYKLSILKSTGGDPAATQRQFFEYDSLPGLGHFIHTYKCDGNPVVPSFEGEPKPVAISGDIDSFTNELWDSLNPDNKISLFVRYIHLASGQAQTRILNKNQ